MLALLLLSVFITYKYSSILQVIDLQDGKSYVQAQRQPENENSTITIWMRIYPHSIKDNVIPLISIRLDSLTGTGPIDENNNRFLEVWMISNGGRMRDGDSPFRFQTVHYNFKNNGDMGMEMDKYPYTWFHMCFGFSKSGPGYGEQVYYANGYKIFHGENMSIMEDFPWLKANLLKVKYFFNL